MRSDGENARSALDDLTRPIARDRRLVRGRIARWLVPVAAFGLVVAFAFVLFIRPVQTYYEQNRIIEERTTQYEQIATVIGQLEAEVERLKTPDGIKEAAREQVGYIDAGEQRVTINQTGQVPTDLPDGWPYSMATQILATRSASPTPNAAPAPDDTGSGTADNTAGVEPATSSATATADAGP